MNQIWCVKFGNYEPAEVDSLWISEELSKRRADILNAQPNSSGMWEASYWGSVQDENSELLK